MNLADDLLQRFRVNFLSFLDALYFTLLNVKCGAMNINRRKEETIVLMWETLPSDSEWTTV
jgi:hypothetical protein